MMLEVSEKDLGVMQFLYAAIKTFPPGMDDGCFTVQTEDGVTTITIMVDADKLPDLNEFIDKE